MTRKILAFAVWLERWATNRLGTTSVYDYVEHINRQYMIVVANNDRLAQQMNAYNETLSNWGVAPPTMTMQ